MTGPHFFGYGSLVNRATHGYAPARPARLNGWRRVWRHAGIRPVAYLTVEAAPGVTIEGLAAPVPGSDWAALDAREGAYERIAVADQAEAGGIVDLSVYKVPDGRHSAPSADHPVLLSYLDTVVQGFLDVYGQAGATAFFETTSGWDAPVRNDRAAPVYPRATRLSARERAFVDAALADLAAVVE